MRLDIQCLRGIAIIGVIVFHLYPSYFPNGYLGVDIFFVISGYLMAVILQKQKLDIRSISEFYYKRIKRIYPIYYLIILLILLFKQYLLADVYWSINNNYGIFSMIFLTNQKIIHDRSDYFNEFKADKSSVNLFIHCWSLSVEIQFYILVPFIFLGLQLFEDRRAKIIITCIISIASYSISFISVDPNFNFNFMFARIWQFAAGIIVTMIAKNVDKKPGQFHEVYRQFEYIIFAILFLIFFPLKLYDGILRLIITITTSFIIYNQFNNNDNNMILSSKLLSYIGDLSYILYLVHWPIINFFQLYHNQLLTIFLIMMISVIIHHSFEVFITRQKFVFVFVITMSLFVFNGTLLYTYIKYPYQLARSHSKKLDSIIRRNMIFTNPGYLHNDCQLQEVEEFKEKAMWTFGHCKYENGNGTQKVLLLGNSYTLNQAETIRRAFNGNYSTFEYVSMVGNYAIFDLDHNDHRTTTYADVSKRIAALIKPDVIFAISRFDPMQKERIEDISNDYVINNMNAHLEFYQRVAKKIYIMGAFPIWPISHLNNFISHLELEIEDLSEFRTTIEVAENEMRNARERLEHLNCPKCEVYDLSGSFLKNGFYYGYDDTKMLSFVDNDIHLTAHGTKHIEGFYRSLVRNMTY